MMFRSVSPLVLCLASCLAASRGMTQEPAPSETLSHLSSRLGQESLQAYKASPFAKFSQDYFARLTRDPEVRAGKNEIALDSTWQIDSPPADSICATMMRGFFQDFLRRSMQISLLEGTNASRWRSGRKQIQFRESGGGLPDTPESYTLEITKNRVLVQGRDPAGLRDGIVRLVD